MCTLNKLTANGPRGSCGWVSDQIEGLHPELDFQTRLGHETEGHQPQGGANEFVNRRKRPKMAHTMEVRRVLAGRCVMQASLCCCCCCCYYWKMFGGDVLGKPLGLMEPPLEVGGGEGGESRKQTPNTDPNRKYRLLRYRPLESMFITNPGSRPKMDAPCPGAINGDALKGSNGGASCWIWWIGFWL